MHIMCVAKRCEAEALHIVSSSKYEAGYGTCTTHLRYVFRIVSGYYGGTVSVALLLPNRSVSASGVIALTSRRQHDLAS